MLALVFSQGISSLRWQLILEAEGAIIPFRTLFTSYMIGMFVNNFMPTSIGGDVFKTYDIYRLTKDSSLSIFSVVFERFSGLVILIILAWIGVSSYLELLPASILGVWTSINIVCIFIFLCMINKSFGGLILRKIKIIRIEKIVEIIHLSYARLIGYNNKRVLLTKLIFISIPIQLIPIMIYKQISITMGVQLPFIFFLYTIPIIIFISLIPISFGGLGVREGSTVLIFSMAEVSTDVSLSISLIYLSITYLVSLIGGLFLIFRGTKIDKLTIVKKDFF